MRFVDVAVEIVAVEIELSPQARAMLDEADRELPDDIRAAALAVADPAARGIGSIARTLDELDLAGRHRVP